MKILSNKKIAEGHYVIVFESPRITKSAKPGQFVQIMTDDGCDPLLPRPFSFLDVDGKCFRILYQVVGKGTTLLSQKKKGESLRVLGPLGNGFNMGAKVKGQSARKLALVGGGVGIPPLYHLAKVVLKDRRSGIGKRDVHVFLGARNRTLLHCESDFRRLGVQLHLATDDGSKGHKGFVTEILNSFLHSSLVPRPSSIKLFTCGPTPMLRAVSEIAVKAGLDCQVSVEEPMPCGFGACIGCAIRVRRQTPDARRQTANRDRFPRLESVVWSLESEYRYAMACSEGPVFNAKDLIW